MKCIPLILLTLFCGCAHKSVCGDLLEYRYAEGSAAEFSANFKDDRVLLSDVTFVGSVREREVVEGGRSGFMISALLDSKAEFQAMEIAVEHGTQGAESYSRDVLYRTSSSFVGKASIVSVECDGGVTDGRFVLNFKRGGEWYRVGFAPAAVVAHL